MFNFAVKFKYSIWILILFSLFQITSSCQTFKDDIVITGEQSWDYWQKNAGWQSYSADYYQPSLDSINLFAKKVNNQEISFIIFASSFCEDCEHELPKIFKIFDLAKISPEHIKIIGLDKAGREPSGIYNKLNAGAIPSLYIMKNNVPVGNCTYPDTEWLAKLLEIIK